MKVLLLSAAVLLVPLRVQVGWHEARAATLTRQRHYAAAAAELLEAHRLAPTPARLVEAARLLERDRQPGAAFELYGQAGRADQQERLARTLAIVEVETDPAGAAIFVDRDDLGWRAHAPARLALEPGVHEIHIRLDGHAEATATVEAVPGGRRAVRLALAAIAAELRVESSPAGAEVFLDGQPESSGRTPTATPVTPGAHEIEVRAEGRRAQRQRIVLSAGERRVVAVALPAEPRATARLVVDSDPDAAFVQIDGRTVGHAPLVTTVLPGPRSLVVTAVGREPGRRTVTMRADRTLAIDARLAPRPGAPPALWLLGVAAASATAGLVLALDRETRAPGVALASFGLGAGGAGVASWSLWDPPGTTLDATDLEAP